MLSTRGVLPSATSGCSTWLSPQRDKLRVGACHLWTYWWPTRRAIRSCILMAHILVLSSEVQLILFRGCTRGLRFFRSVAWRHPFLIFLPALYNNKRKCSLTDHSPFGYYRPHCPTFIDKARFEMVHTIPRDHLEWMCCSVKIRKQRFVFTKSNKKSTQRKEVISLFDFH